MSPDEPYPSTADCPRRFLRLAGRSTLAVAATLLLYSSISLIARGTPPDEWFRLTTLNIPLSVIGGLPFGTLLAGLALFRYRDTRLNLTVLRRAMAAAAWVGAAAALPMLGVYGWLFPGFDRANLAVVVKGSSTPYWSEFGGGDTTDAILWMPGPRWALRGRSIAYTGIRSCWR